MSLARSLAPDLRQGVSWQVHPIVVQRPENCGPGSENPGALCNRAPIQSSDSLVEHGGFEPPTPCLPGKGGPVQIARFEFEITPPASVLCRAVSPYLWS